MKKGAIRVIVTGGTFDKAYDEFSGVMTFKESHLPEILRLSRVKVDVEIEYNQLIDSLEMQDDNRKSIALACAKAKESMIIITHGTDTMVETATKLGTACLPKTIVLTGAMIPWRVQGSDALFNFGTAFSAVQLLGEGVYIAMNGRIFQWYSVRKDTQLGIFKELSE